MLVKMLFIGGTQKEIRFRLEIDGQDYGEFQVGRGQFTRLVDLIFRENYWLTNENDGEKIGEERLDDNRGGGEF